MLDSGSGSHVGSVDVFSSGEDETLPLYEANQTTEVTVANMVSDPNYNKTIHQFNKLNQIGHFS